jgi:hypothetical protein
MPLDRAQYTDVHLSAKTAQDAQDTVFLTGRLNGINDRIERDCEAYTAFYGAHRHEQGSPCTHFERRVLNALSPATV